MEEGEEGTERGEKLMHRTVPYKKLFKDNPISCLSALRALDMCHRCKTYKEAWRKGKLTSLKCKPHIKKEIGYRLTKIRELRTNLTKLNNTLREMNRDLEGY